MRHLTLEVTINVNDEDYAKLQRQPPLIKPSNIRVVTDTGAQSCL